MSSERQSTLLQAGISLREALAAAGISNTTRLHVMNKGGPIREEEWGSYRVSQADELVALRVPGFGFTAVILLVISVLSLIYNLVVAFTTKPPQGTKKPQDPEASNALRGASNSPRPFEPVPIIFGRHRVYPVDAAQPYQEVSGGKHYQRQLMVWGHGPLIIEDIRIGNTPISDYEEVQYVTRSGTPEDPPLSLYTAAATHEQIGLSLEARHATDPPYSDWLERTTPLNTVQVGIDFNFMQGLGRYNADGELRPYAFDLQVQYKPVESGTFGPLTRFFGDTPDWARITSSGVVANNADEKDNGKGTAKAELIGLNFVPEGSPTGQYDVRIRRDETPTEPKRRSGGKGAMSVLADVVVENLKCFQAPTSTLVPPGLATLELRIKGTDQLNGVVDTLNGVCQAILPTYSGGAWTVSGTPTSNPAWAYASLFRGIGPHPYYALTPRNALPVDDVYLDGPGLAAWADWCTASGFEFNWICESDYSVDELRHTIARAGQAQAVVRDTVFGVIQDIPRSTVAQHITTRNSWDFSASRGYEFAPPHGLRFRFRNEEKEWQQDEIVVYADGYDVNNAETFEQVDIPGVTNADQIWRIGRYQLAVRAGRPERYQLNMDAEHMAFGRGDLVRVTHDVPQWGLAAARIKSVQTTSSGLATGITVDEQFTMVSGTNYSVRIRRTVGDSVVSQVVTTPGTVTQLTFSSPLPPSEVPLAGDLLQFGILNQESVRLLVDGIEPHEDLSATIYLVDEAPAVFTSATGTIPPFNSQVTTPLAPENSPPEPPILTSVVPFIKGFEPDGSLDIELQVRLHPSGGVIPTAEFQVQWRPTISGLLGTPTGNAPWNAPPLYPSSQSEILLDVPFSEAYDVRARAVSPRKIASAWVTSNGIHTTGGSNTPTGLSYSQVFQTGAGATNTPVMILSWVGSLSDKQYFIRWSANGVTSTTAKIPANIAAQVQTHFITAPPTGDWEVQVYALGSTGQLSTPATLAFTYRPEAANNPYRITGLELLNQGNSTTFGGRDAKFIWRYASDTLNEQYYNLPEHVVTVSGRGKNIVTTDLTALANDAADDGQLLDPYFKSYRVEIKDPDTLQLLRPPDFPITNTYTYTYEHNIEDGGPRRSIRVEVSAIDINGSASPPTTLVVSNPVPPALTGITVSSALKAATIRYTKPDDIDFAGVLVYMSTNPNFLPGDSGNLVADTLANPISVPVEPPATYYAYLAPYDAFGRIFQTLNVSDRLTIATAQIVGGDIGPGEVDTDNLAPGAVITEATAQGSPAFTVPTSFAEVTGARVTLTDLSAARSLVHIISSMEGTSTLVGAPTSSENLIWTRIQRGAGASPSSWDDVYTSTNPSNVPTAGTSATVGVSQAFQVPTDGTYTFRIQLQYTNKSNAGDSLVIDVFAVTAQELRS